MPTISPGCALIETSRTGHRPAGERHGQVVDGEHVLRPEVALPPSAGSCSGTASASPGRRSPSAEASAVPRSPPLASASPSSVNASAARMIATRRPERDDRRDVDPAEALVEHASPVVVGGCTPSPRKLSPASASSASPTARVHRQQERLGDVRQHVPSRAAARARRRARVPPRRSRSRSRTTRGSASAARSTGRPRTRSRTPLRVRRCRRSPRRRSRGAGRETRPRG